MHAAHDQGLQYPAFHTLYAAYSLAGQTNFSPFPPEAAKSSSGPRDYMQPTIKAKDRLQYPTFHTL